MAFHHLNASRDRRRRTAWLPPVLLAGLLTSVPGLVFAQPSVTASPAAESPDGQQPSAAAAAANTRRDPSLGVLRIVVLDESGAAILGSQVIVRNTATAAERTATANERGEAIFENLPPGKYLVHAESAGFNAFEIPEQNVRRGQNNREVTLKIASFVEQIDVTRDKTDERIADTFSSGLSKEEIDELPDDPDEMQAQLEQMAGPGASMFVNGFSGGRMPPKSQIQSIRFRFDPYSADNHDAGRPRVDVMTRPGNGDWRNSATFTFRDESLNARYPQAESKASEQARRGFWSIEGPLVKGKTSFSLNVSGLDSYDSQTINAQTSPTDIYRAVSQQPTTRMNVDARIEHAINKNNTLRIEVERQNNNQDALGVGGQSLESRAYSQDRHNTEFRISESGLFGKYRNDIRVQYEESVAAFSSFSNAIATNVQGNFVSGGAQMAGGTRAREVQVSDDLDFALNKQHAMRIGFRIDGGNYFSDATQNTAGTFTYRSLAAYEGGLPAQYAIRRGDPVINYSNVQAAFYVTDDYKLRKNVMLSLGARYEGQTHVDDWNNIAPRISTTWSPFKSNRTTVRAGFGIFYDWYGTSTYSQTIQLDGEHQYDEIIQNPSLTDPLNSGTGIPLAPSIVRQAENLSLPTIRRFSVGVDQQITSWLRVRTNYFNQHGWNELRSLNANYPVSGTRPDTDLGNISEIQSIGKSDSQGVDFGFNIMMPQRKLFAFINYTLASAKDDGSSLTLSPSNTLATEWGYASTDIRHRLFAMFTTPVWKALRANTNIRYQSGPRYNVTAGVDTNLDGNFNERPAGFARNSGRGDGQLVMDLRLGWTIGFGPDKPQTPGRGPGGGGPRIIQGPGPGGGGPGGGGGGGGMMGGGPGGGDSNKRYTVEIFTQANNLLNHAVYTSYVGVITSGQFGLPTSTQPPRRIEVGTRFGF